MKVTTKDDISTKTSSYLVAQLIDNTKVAEFFEGSEDIKSLPLVGAGKKTDSW